VSDASVSPQALAQFFSNLYHYGLEKAAHRWYSVYEAEVVSIEDNPDGMGRIDMIVPVISDSTIRSARPLFPVGSFLSPYVGDKVWAMFAHGDVNRPLYVGGWVTVGDGEAPFPEDVSTPTNPTTRVIKFKTGAIVFEDGTDKRVELYTKELDSETKNRAIRLHDAMEEIVVAAKNGHYVRLNDMEDFFKVFVDTSGGSGAAGHSFLMDGPNGVLNLKSALEQELLIEDQSMSMTLKNKLGDNLTIKSAQLLRLASALGVGMEILPATGVITIKDVGGNIISITPAGISVTSATLLNMVAGGAISQVGQGIVQFSAGGAPVTTFGTGNTTSFFLGSMTSTIVGAITAILLGATTVTSVGTISLLGPLIVLGGVAGTSLVTLAFLLLVYNLHTHVATGFGVPTSPPTPTVGGAGVPEAVVTTQNVKAS